MGARRIAKIDRDGAYRVVVDAYEGEPFTGPNDLWLDDQGGLYFSDSYPSLNPEGKPEFCVYSMAPGSSRLERIIDDLYKGKGIHITPDEKWI
jgi:gluconolactonase